MRKSEGRNTMRRRRWKRNEKSEGRGSMGRRKRRKKNEK